MAYLLFWGVTTILMFWAALIKATRQWGGKETQGLGFGILDGGRGLVASVFASIAILILESSYIEQSASLLDKQGALKQVIIFYTVSTALMSVLAWIFIPREKEIVRQRDESKFDFQKIFIVIKNKNIWLLSMIVVTAYCGYKALDNYGLYAHKILGMSEVDSAKFTTMLSYSRAIVAVLTGFMADKWKPNKILCFIFAVITLCFFILSFLAPVGLSAIVLGNLIITVFGVYGLRAIYFAVIEEVKIDVAATGTAVGAVSVMGYTPDIFFASVTGRILDSGGDLVGFQRYFLFLAVAMIIGLTCSLLILKVTNKNRPKSIDSKDSNN